MGESNSVHVFKGPSLDEFRDALALVVTKLGGRLDWNPSLHPIDAEVLTSHNANVHAAYLGKFEVVIAENLGITLQIPWINVRIQEGSLWDYSLYEGGTNLHNFSTLPEYWNDDSAWHATQRGDVEQLARVWHVPRAEVENYLKPWGYELDEEEGVINTILRGKAYPADEFEYGDIWQMTDFLRALGAHDPNFDQPHCHARSIIFDSH